MRPAKFRGEDVMVSAERIRSENREEGYHYYEFRHGDSTYKPLTVEPKVIVNYCGTMRTTKPLELEQEGQWVGINLTKQERASLAQYLNNDLIKK